MHVLEGLSCGLPILYIDHDGGGKDICQFNENKVGESFKDFTQLKQALYKIIVYHDSYVKNIEKNINLYSSDRCYEDYCRLFINIK